MKNYMVLVLSAILTVAVVWGCKKAFPTEEGYSPIQKSIKLNFEIFCSAPIHGDESTVIINYNNNIMIDGSFIFQVYDTISKTWQVKEVYGDSVASRWDGAACYLNNHIYSFGTPWDNNNAEWYKVVKIDPATLNSWWLPEKLPFTKYTPYPAYTTYNNKMIAVFPQVDSVYVFDGATEKGKLVAPNPLRISNEYLDSPCYIYGTYNDSLYIFNETSSKFYRLSLASYAWSEIQIPSDIKGIIETEGVYGGGIWGGWMICFRENNSICYNFSKKEWYFANNDIDFDYRYSESCFTTADALYYISHLKLIIWRITIGTVN